MLPSNEFYAKAAKRDPARKDSLLRQTILREMGLNFLDLRDGKKAASIFQQAIKESPNSKDRPAVLLGRGRAYALIGKKDDARKMLNAVIAEFPESEQAGEARKLLPGL
jgi:TolA-binding protein